MLRELVEAFAGADLIISKGQGNFESLNHIRDKDIFFLFLSKCKAVSQFLGTQKNDIIFGYSKKDWSI